MENLTVIVPIVVLNTDEKKEMFINALSSIDDSNIIVVGEKKAIESLNDIDLSKFIFTTLINTGKDKSYVSNVNFALKNIKSEYFSILEYDDMYSSIWFKNVEEYINKDIDYGYAMTVHKTQGSTFNNVAIDLTNLVFTWTPYGRKEVDIDTRNKLMYVALSRAKNSVLLKY